MQQFGSKKPLIKKEVLFSFIVLVIFFAVLGIWAGFAPLETAAIAPGKIIVSGYQKSIQHLEGGIVKSILVKDGDVVNKNQIVMTLDSTQAMTALKVTQNQLNENNAALMRIQAELDGQKTLSLSSVDGQIAAIQRSIFNNNQKAFSETVGIYREKILQLTHQITGTQAKMAANKQQLYFIDKELKDVRALAKERLVKQSRLLALEREAARIAGLQAELAAEVSQLKQKIGETNIEITKFKSDNRQKLLDELKTAHERIQDLTQQEITQNDMLKRTVIRSPIAGTVVGLQVHTASGVIKPGEVLMNIVPGNESLVVEVRLNPLDIDVVHVGMPAEVRITSFNRRTAPLLVGKLINVSADALVDQTTGRSYYLAQITIPQTQMQKLSKNERLYPGMPVEAMIVTNKLTPWEYFMTPVHRSFNRAFRED